MNRINQTILTGRLIAAAIACCAILATAVHAADPQRPPNFVFLMADNFGYGDIGCLGSMVHRTPHLDRMAAEGMIFTSFYVTSGVCTPSRSSIMTACYPRRVNLHVSDTGGSVLQPVSPKGLHPNEVTIAEVLKTRGYSTACIGKWHLGDQPPYLPTRQGFDYYLGIPYSDDMTPREGRPWPPLPLMENEQVIEAAVDRNELTKLYTQRAIEFMAAHRDRPFFLYLPHAMPGSTRAPFASEAFRGKSANGPYGDSVEELDWSTGEILAAIKQLGIDEQTLVIYTSDNGAPQRNPLQGSNLPMGGWGYTTSEGGQRMPFIARWPGRIPAGSRCDELCTSMDMMPTFAHLAGAKMPDDRIIDGRNIWPLFAGEPGARTPHEAFYYYYIDQLQAVRSGRWKLYLPIEARARGRGRPQQWEARLFDVVADPGETTDHADKHPDVIQRLLALADKAREDLGDIDREGKGQRPAGHYPDPTPRVTIYR